MASVPAEVGDRPQGVPVARCRCGRWLAGCPDAPDVSAARSGHVAPSDRSPETAAETITGELIEVGAVGPNILPRLQFRPGVATQNSPDRGAGERWLDSPDLPVAFQSGFHSASTSASVSARVPAPGAPPDAPPGPLPT